jgi:hypothetical protein
VARCLIRTLTRTLRRRARWCSLGAVWVLSIFWSLPVASADEYALAAQLPVATPAIQQAETTARASTGGYDVILVPRQGAGPPRILTERGWSTWRQPAAREADANARYRGRQGRREPQDQRTYGYTPRDDGRPYRPRWQGPSTGKSTPWDRKNPGPRYGIGPPGWRADGAGAVRREWRKPRLDQWVANGANGPLESLRPYRSN